MQALLQSPMFGDALALERDARAGAPALHAAAGACRRRSSGCAPTICWRPCFPQAGRLPGEHGGGPRIELPDHPLVRETIDDCLHEAMDVDGLIAVLERMRDGQIQRLSRDTAEPSPFAHDILNAKPYTFLDDAPLEERRARAVGTRRTNAADARHRSIARPSPRSRGGAARSARSPTSCTICCARRSRSGRSIAGTTGSTSWLPAGRASLWHGRWVATERRAIAEAAWGDDDVATTALVGGFLLSAGPLTVSAIADVLDLPPPRVDIALARLEADGRVLQGHFSEPGAAERHVVPTKLPTEWPIEWCERGLLQRMHRRTLGALRERVRPVSPADYIRFLVRWQHAMPGTRLHGVEGVAKVIEQLEGFELPAAAWERDILPARIHDYQPAMLDELCLSGEMAWARLRVTPPESEPSPRARAGAIGLFTRAHAGWLIDPYAATDAPPSTGSTCRRWRARWRRRCTRAAPPS